MQYLHSGILYYHILLVTVILRLLIMKSHVSLEDGTNMISIFRGCYFLPHLESYLFFLHLYHVIDKWNIYFFFLFILSPSNTYHKHNNYLTKFCNVWPGFWYHYLTYYSCKSGGKYESKAISKVMHLFFHLCHTDNNERALLFLCIRWSFSFTIIWY